MAIAEQRVDAVRERARFLNRATPPHILTLVLIAGIGALLIRRAVFRKMKRPWFAGGTVNFASVQGNGHYLAPNEAAFEDGTVNYLNIPAIKKIRLISSRNERPSTAAKNSGGTS